MEMMIEVMVSTMMAAMPIMMLMRVMIHTRRAMGI